MATKRDYYEILGIGKDADADALKSAYRKLAVQYHPDKNKGNKEAEEKFKEATEAYEVLKDPAKRKQYDQFGHAAFSQGGGGGGFRGFQDFDLSDALRSFMNDFGGDSFFSDFFGGGGRRGGGRRGGPPAGRDLQVRLSLTLEEIATGTSKKIKYKKMEKCPDCGGSGGTGVQNCSQCGGSGQVRRVSNSIFGQMVNVVVCPACNGQGQTISNKCRTCSGEGRKQVETTVSVNIPAGVAEGNYIPLRGMGDVGAQGGPAGDLIVLIEEEPHKVFDRHGLDIVTELSITAPQAALGDSVMLNTLEGKVKLTVAPGTQSESILRLRGKGIPEVNNARNRGDVLVKIHVAVPERLSSEEKELYQKLMEIDSKKTGGGGFFRKAAQWFES
ncbi:MAG: molecular chaperone DnaJ [Fibrobacteres bacterium]|nr:molecular chaperone DnaJ [Fibrobacterota bacterium]